ncbi:MAG TPA: GlsB/YeaQ/YmgE family stress response membrane protein [Ktedonosporobacter sp.]|nr:GlsB/YeaQ/YmgE family stress response membrane protein [Ktedonosporobacter sp.]
MTVASLILADLTLSSVLWWLVLGLIAGFLASVVMRGGGYGIVGDIVVGIVGAFIGGWLAGLLGLGANGFIGSLIIAFIGACILIAILRAVSGGFGRRRT